MDTVHFFLFKMWNAIIFSLANELFASSPRALEHPSRAWHQANRFLFVDVRGLCIKNKSKPYVKAKVHALGGQSAKQFIEMETDTLNRKRYKISLIGWEKSIHPFPEWQEAEVGQLKVNSSGSVVMNPPDNAGDTSLIPGLERSPGIEHGNSCILVWGISWTKEPGELQSMGLQSWTRLCD